MEDVEYAIQADYAAKRETTEVSNRVTALGQVEAALAKGLSELEDRLISVLRSEGDKTMASVPREAFETTLAQTLDMAVVSLETSEERLRSILRRLEL